MKQGIAIAIDGPAGSGKSTIAQAVAAHFNYRYIDTGAMYRALTLKALQQQIPLDDGVALTALTEGTRIELRYLPSASGPSLQLIMDGMDVTEAIRSLAVTNNVSVVAAVAGVRTGLVRLQQQLAAEGGVVMDGRDIGMVVLPQAELKVFLTAAVAERSRRRWLELQTQGVTVDLAELEQQIERRDQIDSNRAINPLRQAPDAVLVDTTVLSIEEVVARVVDLAEQRGAKPLNA